MGRSPYTWPGVLIVTDDQGRHLEGRCSRCRWLYRAAYADQGDLLPIVNEHLSRTHPDLLAEYGDERSVSFVQVKKHLSPWDVIRMRRAAGRSAI